MPAVREGRAAVQDEGSQHLALVLAAAEVPQGLPARWLDLCAGPGGKAGVLGGLGLEAGADLVAVEVSPHRADLVRQTLRTLAERAAGLGRSVEVRTADGREVGGDEPGGYARVLVDAPCSNTGVLAKRVEARRRLTDGEALASLVAIQARLLDAAATRVRSGGRLVWSTCSVDDEENGARVRAFLASHPDFALASERTTLPLAGRRDGGYVAVMERP